MFQLVVVVGSSPTRGAIKRYICQRHIYLFIFLVLNLNQDSLLKDISPRLLTAMTPTADDRRKKKDASSRQEQGV